MAVVNEDGRDTTVYQTIRKRGGALPSLFLRGGRLVVPLVDRAHEGLHLVNLRLVGDVCGDALPWEFY